jgi:hypothetical protein
MKLVGQELVGMLRFNSPPIERLGREVLEIDRDNEIRTPLNRSSEDMAIIWVGTQYPILSS